MSDERIGLLSRKFLCVLCALCVLCVKRSLPAAHVYVTQDKPWEFSLNTEGTEAQRHRGTEELRYFSSGLSKPFDTSGRTGVDEASALGRRTTLDRASSQTNGSAC